MSVAMYCVYLSGIQRRIQHRLEPNGFGRYGLTRMTRKHKTAVELFEAAFTLWPSKRLAYGRLGVHCKTDARDSVTCSACRVLWFYTTRRRLGGYANGMKKMKQRMNTCAWAKTSYSGQIFQPTLGAVSQGLAVKIVCMTRQVSSVHDMFL